VHATTSLEGNNTTEDLFQKDLRAVQELSETVKMFFGPISNSSISPAPIIGDITFLRQRYQIVDQYRRSQLKYEASIASLKESRLGIQQIQSVKRLTQLAFILIPLSFITSVFGMNIKLLVGRWCTVVGSSNWSSDRICHYCYGQHWAESVKNQGMEKKTEI